MSSHKFKNMSSGRSVRNTANNFLRSFSPAQTHYGTIFSSADMAHSLEESGLNDLAHMDKRSAHNALERLRRETLNTKFQQLAHTLPSLQSVRRPSKTVIVAKSLDFVSQAISRENMFQKKIDNLRRENNRLRDEAKNRAKQQGRKSASSTVAAAATKTTPTTSECSLSFDDALYLSPQQLMVNPQQESQQPTEASDLTKATPPLSSSSPPTSSTTDAVATPMSSDLTTSGSMAKRLPSSTSMASTSTVNSSSSSTSAPNTSVKRRKSVNEPNKKKRNRNSISPPTITSETIDTMSTSINDDLLTVYGPPSTISHLTPTPQALALRDQEVFQHDLATPLIHSNNDYYLSPFTTAAMMVPQPPPLGSVSHHHAAVTAAAAATISAQQQQQHHHLVAPFPTSTIVSDDRAMMPHFQPAMMDMSSSFRVDISTPPSSSYMPNPGYHQVVYHPPYPQLDQSAISTYYYYDV